MQIYGIKILKRKKQRTTLQKEIPCVTYELLASLKPFSIAGIKFEGIACPMTIFSNSNFVGESIGRGSIYLPRIVDKKKLRKHINYGYCQSIPMTDRMYGEHI